MLVSGEVVGRRQLCHVGGVKFYGTPLLDERAKVLSLALPVAFEDVARVAAFQIARSADHPPAARNGEGLRVLLEKMGGKRETMREERKKLVLMLHDWNSFRGLRFSHSSGRQTGTRVA